MISLTVIYQILNLQFHIPKENLNYFWVIPSLLSSLQLFYFGTFIPHSQPIGGYIQPHNAQTINRPIWWSFITCYHFGYHEEHHEYPHVPWWKLPQIYRINAESSSSTPYPAGTTTSNDCAEIDRSQDSGQVTH